MTDDLASPQLHPPPRSETLRLHHLALTTGCLAILATTAPALACGGLFCAVPSGPLAPSPIDQNAERILFEVDEPNGTITAHVQIQYAGNPDSFAWIVPVPGVPDVSESSDALFAALDNNTSLQVIPPPSEPCDFASASTGTNGCGCAGSSADLATGGAIEPTLGESNNVNIYDRGTTTNYDYVVLGAERTQALVTWLQENQFNVSDNMTPVMDAYNAPADGDAGMRFLAIRLRDGRDNSDIAPLRFTYRAPNPVIPIQLTAVAAQPQMGILVYIAATRPYTPGNYGVLQPMPSQILVDAQYRTNYFDWVARIADEARGQRFISEYIGANPLRGGTFNGVTVTAPLLSRFYTRMSAHHMTLDPTFVPAPDEALRVSNTLDLSNNTALYRCGALLTERLPSPCAFNYCGLGATCTEFLGQVACDCPDDQIAQRITGPDSLPRVACALAQNPVGVTDEAAGVGTDFDPCRDIACGDGQCVVKGGFPTCACDDGAAATLNTGGLLRCEPIPSDAPAFGPGGGTEAAPRVIASAPSPRRTLPFALSLSGPLLLVLGALSALRLRNRP